MFQSAAEHEGTSASFFDHLWPYSKATSSGFKVTMFFLEDVAIFSKRALFKNSD